MTELVVQYEAIANVDNKLKRTVLTSGDFNSLTVSIGAENKYYYGASIQTMTNAPIGTTGSFSLDVIDMNSYTVQQLTVYGVNAVHLYQRQQYWGGAKTWGPWQEFARDVIKCDTAVSIPASGSSVTKNLPGITADHVLVMWNFSSSAENNPPVSPTWTTAAGTFTITNNGGTTSETIKPVFIMPTAKTAT